jgi:hypothetical protein
MKKYILSILITVISTHLSVICMKRDDNMKPDDKWLREMILIKTDNWTTSGELYSAIIDGIEKERRERREHVRWNKQIKSIIRERISHYK